MIDSVLQFDRYLYFVYDFLFSLLLIVIYFAFNHYLIIRFPDRCQSLFICLILVVVFNSRN